MASFRIEIPGKRPAHYTLYKQVTSVGACPDSDVTLPAPLVPESFAQVVCDGSSHSIATLTKEVDLFVNGRKRRKHKLAEGDTLTVGPLTITFSLSDQEQTTPKSSDAAYERLFAFSAKLMARDELPLLLDDLMDAVIEVSGAQRGFLLLADGGEHRVRVARNMNAENLADAERLLSDTIVKRVMTDRKPLILSDAMNDASFQNSVSVMNLKLSSVLCVPLLSQGNLLGLIYLGNDSAVHLFEERTLSLMTVFAAHASLIVRNALLLGKLHLENQELAKRLETIQFGSIVGTSPAMQAIYRTVEKVATTDVSVLITGETGTGKELIAREIHARSNRANGPFVTINCGAIPENLLESEFFGHEKGAFTGAATRTIGRFQAAHKGTLFLDEIGEMPLDLQVKILRAIQERSVTPVGGTKPRDVDIRILAATHRTLPDEMAAGRFREDLYYRLNVVHLELPPLRDRAGDIEVLSRFLLRRLADDLGAPVKGFSPAAVSALRKHAFPGNIRELENRIKKAVVLAEGALLGPSDLGFSGAPQDVVLSLADAKERFQREYINEILEKNGGNRTQTARDLGVDPRTVFRHLEKESQDAE